MHIKLRWLLPLLQVLLAAALLVSNFRRPDRIENPAWTKADRQLCDGLKAPAALIRFGVLKATDKWMPNHSVADFVIDTLGYLALVAVLWYFVAKEIVRHLALKRGALARRSPLRNIADCALVLFGIVLVGFGILVRRQFGFPIGAYATVVALPYFIWGIVLAGLYGRDLWVSVSVAQETVANADVYCEARRG